MRKYFFLYSISLIVVFATLSFTHQNNQLNSSDTNQIVGDLSNNKIINTFGLLPKVSIDDVLIIRSKELFQLKYDTCAVIKNIKLLVIFSDSIIKKTVDLRHPQTVNKKGKVPKIICDYYFVIDADSVIKEANGIILLQKDKHQKLSFSNPQSTTDIIVNQDIKVGELGIKKIKTKISSIVNSDLHIEFSKSIPVLDNFKNDLYDYDEFISCEKLAFFIYKGKRLNTGLIWNSPEGFAGH